MKFSGSYTTEEVETLKKLYPDHFDYEIAEMMGRTRKSIEGKISQLGLTGRPAPSTIRKMRNWKRCEEKFGKPIKDVLYTLHWGLELPVRNGMDKELGVDSKAVNNWMDELKIPKRSISEDNCRRYSTMTEEQIKAQTMTANEAVRVNGQPKNIGRKSWSTGLTKHDHPSLKAISENRMGENNPMWNKRREASPRWTGADLYWKHRDWFEIREKVKIRDNHACQDCGITQEELFNLNGLYLQVHHKIPYRICKEHDPENLITLCPSCHSKADGNLKGMEKWKLNELSGLGDVDQHQSIIFQF